MVKHTFRTIAFLIAWGILPKVILAQGNAMPKPRLTIFIPLMLDSSVVEGKPVYTKSIPAPLMNALDFYNGVQIAAGELEAQGIAARIQVIDSKAPDCMNKFFRDTAFEGKGIVIAAVQTSAELKAIADKLKPLEVPLITILPSDAGIWGYPQMMITNSTLKVHCEQLHLFLQRNHSIDNLVLLNMPGNAEAKLLQYLKDFNKTTKSVPLSWNEMPYADPTPVEKFLPKLDSNRLNVIVAPSLNTTTAQKIVKMLSTLAPKYRTAVFGMPTWETINFSKTEFKSVDVWYGTPFLTSSGNSLLNDEFNKKYKELTNSKPGDMAYRGYELTFRYVRTLSQYGPTFLGHINDYKFKLFNDFEFEPVSLRENGAVDYLENQKIYFIKKTDGAIRTILSP